MAAKKKSAKKKTAKKKSTKKKGGRKVVRARWVRITTKAVVPKARGVKRKRPSTVRWENKDTIRHTIKFQIWPFEGSKVTIVLDPGEKSDPFKVDKTVAPMSQFSYTVTPPPSLGPPGGPTVDCED